MSNIFIPDYLNIDYTTVVTSIKEELSKNDVFRDFNYEGSNIAVLIELIAYLAELNTYFLNKIAKNVFIETSDIYENVNKIARQNGYEPKGYISSKTTLNITIPSASNFSQGDSLYIPTYKQFYSTKTYENSVIKFANVNSHTQTASGSSINISLPVVQGDPITLNFTGDDIVDNEILLPAYNYSYDDDLEDDINTFEVTVNGVAWSRISDFYDEINTLSDVDTVYMIKYTKYGETKIVFNSSRSVPDSDDEIVVYALKSLGSNGNVAANTIISAQSNFIKNLTDTTVGSNGDGWLDNSTITISNSAASVGGSDPEDIDEIRENTKASLKTQYRCVTSSDYKSYLETHDSVEKAYAYGEKDIAPSGSILEYNKVHLCVIPPNSPEEWSTNTLITSADTWTPDGHDTSYPIRVATEYNRIYTLDIEEYLEPRKILNAYEVWEVPELVYFTFDIGVRLQRLYSLDDVSNDILNKLIYYFRTKNMNFYQTINFMDIEEYLIDTSEVSPTDNFTYIKGIRNLVIRDIDCNYTIYESNTDGNYPQYTTASYDSEVDNRLRTIQLGYKQFPILQSDAVTITEE